MAGTLRFQDWTPLLRELRTDGFRPRPLSSEVDGIYRFVIDAAEWKLRFTDDMPLFYVSPSDTAGLSEFDLIDRVHELARKTTLVQDAFLIVDRRADAMKEEFRRALYPKIIVIDANDQRGLLSGQPTSLSRALMTLVIARYKLTDLVPYHIGGRATRFFGRKNEVNRILRHDDANFFVTGIRRVGKTFLLKECYRILKAARAQGPEPIFLDCTNIETTDEFTKTLVREIDFREYATYERRGWQSHDIRRFLRQRTKKGRLVIFLDEVDRLLKRPPEALRFTQFIRASTNEGSSRFILAGFHELKAEMSRGDSPLYVASDPFDLEPFTWDDTSEMVLGPLSALGVKFEDAHAIVSRIHNDTGGMPPLIQFYCRELSNLIETRQERMVRIEDLRQLHTREEFKKLIFNTFRDTAKKEDQLLLYILLQRFGPDRQTYNQEELYDAAHAAGWQIPADDVDRACDRLNVAGFLKREPKGTFRFTAPVLAKVITRTHNVEYLIRALRGELAI